MNHANHYTLKVLTLRDAEAGTVTIDGPSPSPVPPLIVLF